MHYPSISLCHYIYMYISLPHQRTPPLLGSTGSTASIAGMQTTDNTENTENTGMSTELSHYSHYPITSFSLNPYVLPALSHYTLSHYLIIPILGDARSPTRPRKAARAVVVAVVMMATMRSGSSIRRQANNQVEEPYDPRTQRSAVQISCCVGRCSSLRAGISN